ncbi:hypothetical protein DPEC_G00235840 [Dallia pectoralis]|uniref:Uncharacterized protein n=1 Tax=Dallia pectoralis TaxID=75939 RepID=A0ACC2FYK8_DALPE|nr:hypothetical protein DPEC_G00235840 [Dallia pectoralis]
MSLRRLVCKVFDPEMNARVSLLVTGNRKQRGTLETVTISAQCSGRVLEEVIPMRGIKPKSEALGAPRQVRVGHPGGVGHTIIDHSQYRDTTPKKSIRRRVVRRSVSDADSLTAHQTVPQSTSPGRKTSNLAPLPSR